MGSAGKMLGDATCRTAFGLCLFDVPQRRVWIAPCEHESVVYSCSGQHSQNRRRNPQPPQPPEAVGAAYHAVRMLLAPVSFQISRTLGMSQSPRGTCIVSVRRSSFALTDHFLPDPRIWRDMNVGVNIRNRKLIFNGTENVKKYLDENLSTDKL
jgi:hypothetical protein